MSSKRQKRMRKKAAKVTLPGGESKPQHRAGAKPAEDPRKPTLTKRCQIMGVEPTKEAMDAMKDPQFGEHVGFCIAAAAPSHQIGRAWDTWCRITAARRNWRQKNIGATGDPANSNLPMMAEPMETDQSASVDLRTPEERIDAARKADQFWGDLIEAVPWMVQRQHLRLAVRGMGGPWWQEGKPTQKGRHLVLALLSVADMADGRPGTARG